MLVFAKRHGAIQLEMEEARVRICGDRQKQIVELTGNRDSRLEAITVAVLPTLYGGELTPVAYETLINLRRDIWETARGGTKLP